MSKKTKTQDSIRDLNAGTTAALRDSDVRHAGRLVDNLIAENSLDVEANVPVGVLLHYREHVRQQLLGELEEQGRLLPADTQTLPTGHSYHATKVFGCVACRTLGPGHVVDAEGRLAA